MNTFTDPCDLNNCENKFRMPRLRRVLGSVFDVLFYLSKLVCVLIIAVFLMIGATTVSHVYFNFCPITMRSFTDKDVVAIKYGRYTDFYGGPIDDNIARQVAERKIVLGGCVMMPFSAVCPYCPCIVRF